MFADMKELDIKVLPETDTARVEDMVKSYFDKADNVRHTFIRRTDKVGI